MNHVKHVMSILTADHLVSQLKEIIAEISTSDELDGMVLINFTVADFQAIKHCFYCSKAFLKLMCDAYVGRLVRMYVEEARGVRPSEIMKIFEKSDVPEKKAVDRLYDHYHKLYGDVSPDDERKIEKIVETVYATMASDMNLSTKH
jgi:hypothetical protein